MALPLKRRIAQAPDRVTHAAQILRELVGAAQALHHALQASGVASRNDWHNVEKQQVLTSRGAKGGGRQTSWNDGVNGDGAVSHRIDIERLEYMSEEAGR